MNCETRLKGLKRIRQGVGIALLVGCFEVGQSRSVNIHTAFQSGSAFTHHLEFGPGQP